MSDYLEAIDKQRRFLYKKFHRNLLRPYLLHLYAPLQRIQRAKRKITAQLRLNIYDDLEDLVLYAIYNILLYTVVLLNRGTLTVYGYKEVYSMLQGEHTRTMFFTDIKTLTDTYEYLKKTLTSTMHSTINHTGYGNVMTIDLCNKLIGVPRLRQHRINDDGCLIPEMMRFLNLTCWPEFSADQADKSDLIPGTFDQELSSIWKYTTASETQTPTVAGHIAWYSGGGYVAYMGRNIESSTEKITRLVDDFWINKKTRALFVEFLIYNANYNVFVPVRLLLEQSATGYFTKTIQVDVVRMLFVKNEMELSAIIFYLLFFVWTVILVIKLFIGIYKYFPLFYTRMWLMVDFFINFLSCLCIGFFLWRVVMVQKYLHALEEVEHDLFVSYFNLVWIEDALVISAGILICAATVRLWKFLRFGTFFRILERTLSMAAFALFAVSFGFLLTLTAFGFSGLLIFGNQFPELSSFVKIVSTLIQLSLKPDQFDIGVYLYFRISYAYFSLYLIFMQVILLIYITVIIMAYTKAQLEYSVQPDRFTVASYAREQLKYLPKLIRTKFHRLRAGGDTTIPDAEIKNPVTPKADEFRYANCMGVPRNRMSSMRFITSCVLRNMQQSDIQRQVLTEYETNLMLGVCRTFVLRMEEDDLEMYFKGHFAGEKCQLVDEKKIDKMAAVVEKMFKGSGKAKKEEVREIIECSKMAREKNVTLARCKMKLKLMEFRLKEAEQLLDSVLADEFLG